MEYTLDDFLKLSREYENRERQKPLEIPHLNIPEVDDIIRAVLMDQGDMCGYIKFMELKSTT